MPTSLDGWLLILAYTVTTCAILVGATSATFALLPPLARALRSTAPKTTMGLLVVIGALANVALLRWPIPYAFEKLLDRFGVYVLIDSGWRPWWGYIVVGLVLVIPIICAVVVAYRIRSRQREAAS